MSTPTKSGFVPVTGGQVYYATYGSGSPLVLLHGGLMTIDNFGPIIPLLAADHESDRRRSPGARPYRPARPADEF